MEHGSGRNNERNLKCCGVKGAVEDRTKVEKNTASKTENNKHLIPLHSTGKKVIDFLHFSQILFCFPNLYDSSK